MIRATNHNIVIMTVIKAVIIVGIIAGIIVGRNAATPPYIALFNWGGRHSLISHHGGHISDMGSRYEWLSC